jgi:protein-S-isoprenylcysteine O-methyltransferase Ste14
MSLRTVFEKVPPAVFFAACLLSGWALGVFRPLSLGLDAVPTRLPLALSVFVLAGAIGAWAFLTFRKARTSPMPFGTPSQLLTSGPFRFSRNPLYVALILVLIAFSSLLDSAWVLATVPVLALAVRAYIVPGEEARLLSLFGGQYTAYTSRVRRWL